MNFGQIIDPSPQIAWDLPPGSYSAFRLQHATPQHIHITTRRTFIGPIPEGWLRSHRKTWYKRSLSLSNYSSRIATFSTSPNLGHGKSSSRTGSLGNAAFSASFPQPADADGDHDGDEENEVSREDRHTGASLESSSAKIASPASLKRDLDNKRIPDSNKSNRLLSAPLSHAAPHDLQKQDVAFKKNILNPSGPSFVKAHRSIERFQSPSGRNSGDITDQVLKCSSGIEGPGAPPMTEPELPSPISFGNATESGEEALLPVGNAPTSTTSLIPHGPNHNTASDIVVQETSAVPPNPALTGLVRFNVPEVRVEEESQLRSALSQSRRRRSWKQLRRGKSHPGEIVKMEKMLVRVDSTMQELPPDYNENDSLKTDSHIVEKWREFIVVCRESVDEDSDYSIQMYKSRVIPAVEKSQVSSRAAHEIFLIRRNTRVNLYSALDKTLVIWVPWKVGTRIYILRTRSSASAVEWYTFIRSSLGWKRSSDLQIHVPDLSVTLQLENPFAEFETSRKSAQASQGDEVAIRKTVDAERAVASSIIQRSMKMLEDWPEWAGVLDTWLKHEKMGLAWKRYDRLEWVHGANEQRMYGTIAMQKSHDLELRPKRHYPTSINSKEGLSLEEPAPVEGFLIRLTSQKGQVKRFGKMFFKRLYFTTHNQYLCYCRPVKALPPPPPKLTLNHDSRIPSPQQIVDRTPLIYPVDPYPTSEGEINWLRHGTPQTRQKHDTEAFQEAERNVNTMLQAEGYIDLSHVVRVQNIQRGNSPADQNIDHGPDVDFHQEVSDSRRDDGKTDQIDDDRIFELVLRNKLVIRLQAYNERTKREWMAGLEKLARYWKARLKDDINVFKMVRQLNLETLDIDEEIESVLGQFAEKWEVTRAEASSQLFNMCGISCCRTITIAGVLYRKPKRHTTFLRCGVILCHSQLLIFHGTLRKRTGKEVPHIQHDRQTAIDLKECYIYSGLVTEGDLLYQNQTFDSNHPGHHALPKVYREDGWTSTDEDTMTCFVLWHGRRKSFFMSNQDEDGKTKQRLRYVSQLGVPGRSIVFKARSRAERDHWVMAIGTEIDRLQSNEAVRVVP